MKPALILIAALTAAPAVAAEQPSPFERACIQAGHGAADVQVGLLAQAYGLEAQVAALKTQLAAETRRADQAEAKMPKPDASKP